MDSLSGARAAIDGGADAIELCAALSLAGLTPTIGLVERVVDDARHAGVSVRAMVRPRPGNFVYDDDDLQTILADTHALIAAGVDGLVFGATSGGALDEPTLRLWSDAVDAANRPVARTLHRAIDLVEDPCAAIDLAVTLGFDTVLTSGGAASAQAGTDRIARMVAHAAGRCRILVGAGIRADIVSDVRDRTGACAFHASARAPSPAGKMPDPFGFGSPPIAADRAIVAALRDAVHG